MKKKIIIILAIILAVIIISIGGAFVFYNKSLEAVDKNDKESVVFIVNNGSTSKNIVDELYDAKLINNKYVGYLYIKINKTSNLQAGIYDLNRSMSFEEIINKICNGDVIDSSVSITFIEGKRLTNYIDVIIEKYPYTKDEILDTLSNKEYLSSLISKYWFLTDDILNDKLYYALEGYLYPDTYFFYEDASIKDIIEVLLNGTAKKLEPFRNLIEESNYSVHEILTLASIIELETIVTDETSKEDLFNVAGVFYNRLNNGMNLGSDVTTYYGARLEMSERGLTQEEIEEVNDYNTRTADMAGKLPVGPICNPSVNAIEAALKPTKHDYFYFVADKNGKTYFTKTNAEHEAKIAELKKAGLWYEYE